MVTMSKTRHVAVVLSVLIALGATELRAQDTPVEPDRRGARATSPELIMSMRGRLELTDEQLAALDRIRAEAVERRSSDRAAMAEALSRFRAGETTRSELRSTMNDLRTRAPQAADNRRAQIEGILTEAQLDTLSELRERRRAIRSGRPGAWRRDRPGMRGRPGMRPSRPGWRDGRGGMWRGRRGGGAEVLRGRG